MPRGFRTRITTRVVALSAAAAALLGLALIVLIVAVTGQRDAARTAFSSQEALTAGNQLEKTLLEIDRGLNRYITSGRRGFLGPVERALAGYEGETATLSRLLTDDPGQQERVQRIGRAIDIYVNVIVRSLISLADEDIDSARSSLRSNGNGGREKLDAIIADFQVLFARERAVIRDREARAEQRSTRAILIGIGGLAFVCVVAFGLTLYLRRSVLRPVRTVAEATSQLAAGDLSTRVEVDTEDEIGELARGFNSMAASLQRGRDELQRSNAELQRSNAELEQFASVTSHDLQAPLTTISMYNELLERLRPDDDAGRRELIDGIREATGQARTLIRDLLEYSRAGRGHLKLEDVPAATVVEHALEGLTGIIEEGGARIEVGPLPVVRVDRANLCRVFQNLVGNAIKFARADEAPQVSIEAERDGEAWRFSVRDNGIGMDPDHARRIFEPFQRLHGEEDYPGTGIGLAVCERIVDQHGGRIWVTSLPGAGSAFHFTLPAGRVAAAGATSVAGVAAERATADV